MSRSTTRSSIWLSLLAATLAAGADLRVLSEFRRVDAQGRIVAPDQGGTVREILSPPVPRNGYTSFRVVVEAAAGQEFTLYVGQNPEENAQVTMYRELAGEGGLPDGLEPVKLPLTMVVPEGQAVVTFWMDLYYARTALVERVKIEPQVWVGDRWLIYPMEIRVSPAIIPGRIPLAEPAGNPGQRAEAAAFAALREHLCGEPPATRPASPLTIRALLYRNARQDLALLKGLPPERTAGLLPAAEEYCKTKPELPMEGWLEIRNRLLRLQ